MFQFLKDIFIGRELTQTGALDFVQKKDDTHFNEVVGSANPVQWREKTSFRMFPNLNQWYSNLCGAFSGRKYLGIYFQQKYGKWIDFEEADIYQRRVNKPGVGMGIADIFNIFNQGVTLKNLTDITVRTDSDADNARIEKFERDVGSIFSIVGRPVYIPAGDIDTIASVIQTTGKGVILMMFFRSDEWGREVPAVLDYTLTSTSPLTLRHFVVATDYTLYKGNKALVIEDSAWFGGINRRIVTESFLKARNIANAYGMNFKFETSNPPKYKGTIVSFQECMQSLGLFPTNVSRIENFGNISRSACIKFQEKYGLTKTGVIDSETAIKLYQLFP